MVQLEGYNKFRADSQNLILYTSAATNDSFMLRPSNYASGDIVALDRAYIDYDKFEELTQREVTYVTKMKKNLVYETVSDTMYMHPEGVMECRVQHVIFRKRVKDGEGIEHHARIITYVDIKKGKARLVPLLTNDMDMEVEDIVSIYRKRWEIELLFKQLKQNFPLRYFYGESANAIKIQIWVTLIAHLLLMVMQRRIKRCWSFPISPPCAASCSCTMSTATRSLNSRRKTGLKYSKWTIRRLTKRHFSIKGAYFSKKESAMPIYRHRGRLLMRF